MAQQPRPVRFGIVGTNFISDWVIAGARLDPRFEPAAVCSRTAERAREFAAKHGIPHTFTSLSEMAASPLIDAVYIASPNSEHALQSITCMRAGKHVLCEKPLASNAREARLMIDTARQCGVTLMEAMKTTLTPGFRAVADCLPQAGTLRRYFASYCQYSSRYDALKRGTVLNAFKPELSNGAIMDIGVYTIYPMVVMFGAPCSVSAIGTLLPTGVDGQGAVNFDYGGMCATVLYSKIANSSLPSEIEGEGGNIIIDRINKIGHVQWVPRGGDATDIATPADTDDYYYEVAHFIDLVLEGRIESPINSHSASLATLEITDAVRRQLGIPFPADSPKNHFYKLC